MTVSAPVQPARATTGIVSAATLPAADILRELGVTADQGLPSDEVAQRQAQYGPNAVSSHRARLLPVLWHQLRSPLLGLLLTAAITSYFVGERDGAVIIGVIVALSVGLGFVNEYRAEKAAEALHSQISHQTTVIRDGRPTTVDVTTLVPGDLIELRLGDIVPADIRLLKVTGLECDESVLTGESLTVENTTAVPSETPLAELSGCALMGTVVHAGSARGIVVATAARTEFGKIATGLSTHQIDTGFQVGLRRFSMLLVYVAGALTTSIFVINVVLHKPIIDALLFSLAIAVGITPQLLPAVVSTSLAAGSRRMRRRKVLVKRLVCIEDLGDVDVLFTDKTGTLTQGRIDREPFGYYPFGGIIEDEATFDGIIMTLLAYSSGTPRCLQDGSALVRHDLCAVVFLLVWPRNGVVMSMQPRPWPDVPGLTARMTRSSSPESLWAMVTLLVDQVLTLWRGVVPIWDGVARRMLCVLVCGS